jgi:hypothetical protein
MHFNFDWSTGQVLWTLTFAALLVLLVVLLGRDRTRRFKWFTISIVLVTLRLLASRMLFGRLAPLTASEIFITLADLATIVSLLVVAELAWRAFGGAQRRTWIIGTLAVLAVGAGVLAVWGPWPAWKTLTADSQLAVLRLMQMAAQKGSMLSDVLTVELGLLVVVFGRRFKAGWRSHTQRIVIGLSTAAMAQLAVQGVWELIALKAVPHSQAEYERILGLREKLFNANEVAYVAVLVWWIVCLWIDEPKAAVAGVPVYVAADATVAEIPASVDAEGAAAETDAASESAERENAR